MTTTVQLVDAALAAVKDRNIIPQVEIVDLLLDIRASDDSEPRRVWLLVMEWDMGSITKSVHTSAQAAYDAVPGMEWNTDAIETFGTHVDHPDLVWYVRGYAITP
jgi:hypothetical protein